MGDVIFDFFTHQAVTHPMTFAFGVFVGYSVKRIKKFFVSLGKSSDE